MVRHSLIDAKRRILVSAGDGDPPNENTTANQGDDIESNGRSHRLIEAKQSIHQSVEEATSDEDKDNETTAASNNVVNGHPLIEAKERIHSNRNLRHDEQNRSIISEEITTEDETITLPSSRHGSSATVQHGAVSVPGVAEGSVRRREPQVVQVSVDHEPSSNTLSASVVEELMIVEANPITFTPKRLRRIGIAMFAAVAALVIGMAILLVDRTNLQASKKLLWNPHLYAQELRENRSKRRPNWPALLTCTFINQRLIDETVWIVHRRLGCFPDRKLRTFV